MNNEEKKRLTKDWICTMLYTEKRRLEYFVKSGCKVMVYGWEYNEFKEILDEMVKEETITLLNDTYILAMPGLYNVKKRTIVPLLNLCEDPEYASAFIEKNKENCDYDFLNDLNGHAYTEGDIEAKTLSYAEKHYDRLAKILALIAKGFSGNPDTGVATL